MECHKPEECGGPAEAEKAEGTHVARLHLAHHEDLHEKVIRVLNRVKFRKFYATHWKHA